MEVTEESVFPEREIVYASFGERFVAMVIDRVIIWILTIPVYALIMRSDAETYLIYIVIAWLYFALLESSRWQATPGKKICGIRVTTTDDRPISFGQATIRYFGKIVSGIILFIGYLIMIANDKYQTLHDKMAGTLVIKTNH